MNSSSQVRIPSIDQDEMTLFVIPNLTGTPERNLLMAILERAILDFVGNDGEALREAEDWIFDLPSPAMPFTFSWICQQLDLNDADIRTRIAQMPKRGNRRIAPWYFRTAGEN